MKNFLIALFITFLLTSSAYAAQRWEKDTLNVYIIENAKEYIMKKAFTKWQSASRERIKFKYVQNEDNADIVVEYVENLPGMVVGLCTNNYSNEEIIYSKIYLARKNNVKAILTNDEYYRIMLHEIGHALGLEHSQNNNSIMRENAMEITDISLSDRKTFQELYGN